MSSDHSRLSPDGSVRIDGVWSDLDERGAGGWVLSITRPRTGETLLTLPDAEWNGEADFHGDEVDLDFRYGGEWRRIRIDLEDWSFVFHPNEQPRPLDELRDELFGVVENAPSSRWARLWQNSLKLLTLLGCLMFVGAGLFLLWTKPGSAPDCWKTIAATAFFALCAVPAWLDWRRR
jgi:hypothetical protein